MVRLWLGPSILLGACDSEYCLQVHGPLYRAWYRIGVIGTVLPYSDLGDNGRISYTMRDFR